MLRSLRDEVESIMEHWYSRTIEALGEKIAHVSAQNVALNAKLDKLAGIVQGRESQSRHE